MRPWYRFCASVAHAVAWLVWGLRVEGRENVPRTGPLLVTSNHRSNLDPALVGSTLPREAGFVAKRELFEVPGLGRLIRSLNAMPLDRSRLSVEVLDRFGEFVERGMALIFFPEGTRQRGGELGRAKVGVGVLLAQHPVPVVPVCVEGTDSLIRSFFRRGRMRVVFGRPYTLPKVEGSVARREDYRRIADAVMDRIRWLKDGLDSTERGAGARVAEARVLEWGPGRRARGIRITREGMEPIS